jgi:hypothetical protein
MPQARARTGWCAQSVFLLILPLRYVQFFIDDREENVFAALSCGMKGVVYDNRVQTSLKTLERILRNTIFDSIERGNAFLRNNKRKLHTYINDGTELPENFTQLLMYEMTKDEYASTPHLGQGSPQCSYQISYINHKT